MLNTRDEKELGETVLPSDGPGRTENCLLRLPESGGYSTGSMTGTQDKWKKTFIRKITFDLVTIQFS